MAIHRDIEFNSMPSEAREAFVAIATSKSNAGGPILFDDALRLGKAIFLSILLAFFLLLIVYGFVAGGYGELGKVNAMMGVENALLLAIALFLLGYNLLATVRKFVLKRITPYPPGKYLLTLDFVDASGSALRIYPLRELMGFAAVHSNSRLQLNFNGGASVSMAAAGKKAMDAAVAALKQRTAEYNLAIDSLDAAQIKRIDPFYALRRTEWNVAVNAPAGQPRIATLPAYLRHRLLVAAGLSFVLVAIIFPIRNLTGDNKLFTAAQSLGTEKAYKDYLAVGWRHKDEIAAGLAGVAFADAKKAKTVSAYRNFLSRYPQSPFNGEAAKAIAELYQQSMDKFKVEAATADQTLIPFMAALLTALEADGRSTVQVRFIRPLTDVLDKTDRDLRGKKVGQKALPIEPIAPHFKADTAGVREQRIVGELNQAFKRIFPADVLNISMPVAVEKSLPIFDIAYNIIPSGVTYTPTEGTISNAFVGIIVRFETNFQLPAGGASRKMSFEISPPPTFTVNYTRAKKAPDVGAGADSVYKTMADRAFDELSGKIRAAFFKPEPASPKGVKPK